MKRTFYTVVAAIQFLCMLSHAALGHAWWALFSAGFFVCAVACAREAA